MATRLWALKTKPWPRVKHSKHDGHLAVLTSVAVLEAEEFMGEVSGRATCFLHCGYDSLHNFIAVGPVHVVIWTIKVVVFIQLLHTARILLGAAGKYFAVCTKIGFDDVPSLSSWCPLRLANVVLVMRCFSVLCSCSVIYCSSRYSLLVSESMDDFRTGKSP